MSVIQRIRDKGAWLIFGIISIALIAFILQDRSLNKGNLFANTTTLGKVNGEKIEKADFEKEMELIRQTNGAQAPPQDQLITGLWSQDVNKIIMHQEYEKLGIVCPPKELESVMFGENSPLKREFSDPKTGVFNADLARQAFDQLKKLKPTEKNKEQQENVQQVYVDPTIEKVLQGKYQSLMQQAMYVPKWLIEKQQADNSQVSSVSYVYVPYTSISDSTIKVSDDDIMAYANKHSKEYSKEDETRAISYVSFDAGASKADTETARSQVMALKNDFATTPDLKTWLAKVGSDMPFYDGYISGSAIKQAQKDSIFKVGVGNIYGPYKDGNAIVMAKLIGTKASPDTVKVRHILIGTIDPQSGQKTREDSTAKKLADSISLAIKKGTNFDSLVAKFSDDGNKDKGGIYDNVTSGQMVPPFNDYIFGGKVGDKAVVKTDFGYHYIEILSQKGSGTAYKIAYLSKPVIIGSETISNASTAAAQFAATSKDKKQFDQNAAKLNKSVMPSGEIKENDFTISSLGQSRALVRWIYEHEAGDVSDPTEINDKYIVGIITSVSKPGLPSATALRPLVEGLVRNEKKSKQIIDSKFKGNNLEAIATSAGVGVQKADSVLFSNSFVAGIGNDGKFVGAAFNKALQGKVSAPIAGTSGVFALRVEKMGVNTNPANDAENIKQGLLQSQRIAVYQGMNALRKAATVKDYRSKFY